MRVCDVPIEHLAFLWPQAAPHLQKALEREKPQRYRAADILPMLARGECRLWISWNPDEKAVEAAMVTAILDYPLCRECRVWLIGGRNMRAWANEFRDTIEAYAKAQGCAHMTSGGRRGWTRVGSYKEVGATMMKTLECRP